MLRYWKTKKFNTKEQLNDFFDKNRNRYQMQEVFINNAFGLDYRPLLKINC